jgi:hypothetical protein
VDKTLVCGTNKLVNWGQVGVGKETRQDSADVLVVKSCPTPPTPPEIPVTGPASIIMSVLGAGALTTTTGYYLASRKVRK